MLLGRFPDYELPDHTGKLRKLSELQGERSADPHAHARPLLPKRTPATFADILIDYYHTIHANLPSVAGQLGAAYAIPILYVPLVMITQVVAVYWLLRQPRQATA